MTETNTIKYKSVFVPGIARKLLKMGHPICDIKPKKENPDASIFIFAETEKFKNDFASIKDVLHKNYQKHKLNNNVID